MFIPHLFLLKGFVWFLSKISRESNPYKGSFEIASVLITRTVFARFEFKISSAIIKAFIPDEQAVETEV